MSVKENKKLVSLLSKARNKWTAEQAGSVIAFILIGLQKSAAADEALARWEAK